MSGLCESRGCESRRDGEAICADAGGCVVMGNINAKIGLGAENSQIVMGRGFGIKRQGDLW